MYVTVKNEKSGLSRSTILRQADTTLTFQQGITGDYRLIDVRSPKEFMEGSLPNAVNIPIFDNDERKLVGTLYKQGGRDLAIDTGFDLVQSRLPDLLADFEKYRNENIAIFCARGGMRSRSVANLLLQNGFSAWQLEGGYKNYRQLLLSIVENFCPRCIVLHGLTGTGKTRILQQLEPMIDLEDLAQHQSSLFGGMNRQPRTQRGFDSHLHKVICELGPEPCFIEGESRQMGNIYLPAGLARALKEGHLIRITASMETRVARIVEDYPVDDEQTAVQVLTILESLRRKLGHTIADKLCMLLKERRLAELVELLLVEYYDKRYENSLQKYHYDGEISSESIDEAAEALMVFRQNLIA